MTLPKNIKLYEKVKRFIYKKYPLHSAYRSGLLVKKYKELGGTYIGKRKGPLAVKRTFNLILILNIFSKYFTN